MKLVILAGGLGTRLSEETDFYPKPMVEIGGRPILWHIMKIYSQFGINEFLICLGYKGYIIKEYFFNYFLHTSDVTIDLSNNSVTTHSSKSEPWKVTLIDTGKETMTGGRLKCVEKYLDQETFCMTYGDGVADVNISQLISFHKENKKHCTLLAVQSPGRFGSLLLSNHNEVKSFVEKPHGDGGWINGGFFVLEHEVFKHIDHAQCVWEQEPLKTLAETNQLSAFKHSRFWHPMDTLRDKRYLEELWSKGQAPWKTWEN